MAQSKKNNKKKKPSPVRRDVVLIVLLAVCFLLMLSIIGIGGIIGRGVGGFLFGIMGSFAYVFPVLTAAAGVFLVFTSEDNFPDKKRIILLAAGFILICTFLSLINSVDPINPAEAFMLGMKEHLGGGFFGGLLSFALLSTIGAIGAYVVDVLAMATVIIIFTQKSFVSYINIKRKEHKARPKPPKKRRDPEIKKQILGQDYNKDSVEDDIPQIQPVDVYDEKIQGLKESFSDTFETPLGSDIKELSNPAITREELISQESQNDNSLKERLEKKVVGIDFDTLKGMEPVQPANQFIANPQEKPSVSQYKLDPVEKVQKEEDTNGSNQDGESPFDMVELSPISVEPVESTEKTETIVTVEERILPETPALEPLEEDFHREEEYIDIPELEPIDSKDQTEEAQEIQSFAELNEKPVESVTSNVESSYTLEPETTAEAEETTPDWTLLEPEVAKEKPQDDTDTTDTPDTQVSLNTKPEPEIDKKESNGSEYIFPPLSLLADKKTSGQGAGDGNENEIANKLVTTLNNFGVEVSVSDISVGPAVTRFELIPQMGVKVSKILNLSNDIMLNLAAESIRIEAPIPGKSAVGIEVPNKVVEMVTLKELIDSNSFRDTASPIAFGAGKDIGGNGVISDIAKMPHVLIAGATGSGKSVCINTIIMSILYKARPDEVKFIMIDPKVVELNVYNGIPHLLIPVVSDPKKAAGALNWAVHEMNERYNKFAGLGVRDLKGYNSKIKNMDPSEHKDAGKVLPRIVVIVDELADLMMVSSSEVEESICRLAQLARACGIHLVIATQRPSVNVITGLIKANMPSRIAFAVTSGVDSRTILDQNGAEELLGKGDMLYFPQGLSKPIRVQGAFVSDDEVTSVVEYITENNAALGTDEETLAGIETQMASSSASGGTQATSDSPDDGRDDYFEAAARLIIEKEKGSIGMLQRNFKIGFNRAARIMDQLASYGIVGPEEGTKPRKVIISLEEFEEILKQDNEGM